MDANVVLDVLTEDPTWAEWSATALARATDAGPLWINPVIYAQISVRFTRIEELDRAVPPGEF